MYLIVVYVNAMAIIFYNYISSKIIILIRQLV